MDVISQQNLNKLNKMGFEITYQAEGFISLYNGKYDLGINLYRADKRDIYQGVYMNIIRDNVVLKECKGRNVISNITRYIGNAVKNQYTGLKDLE